MLDEFTEQAVDILFSNKKIKEKVYPVVYCYVAFNITTMLLLMYISIKLYYLTMV